MFKLVLVFSLCFESFLTQELPESTDGKKLIAKWNLKLNVEPSLELFWTISDTPTSSFITIQESNDLKKIYKNKTTNDYHKLHASLIPNFNYFYQINTYSLTRNTFTASDRSPSSIFTDLAKIQNNSITFNFPAGISTIKNTELFILISNENNSLNAENFREQIQNFSNFQIVLKCNKTSTDSYNYETLLNLCMVVKKNNLVSNTFEVMLVFKTNLIDFIRYEVYETALHDDGKRLVGVSYDSYENPDESSPSSWLYGGIGIAFAVVFLAGAAIGITCWYIKRMKKRQLNIRNDDAVGNPLYGY